MGGVPPSVVETQRVDLSVGFSPFHKVGFGYATAGVPSQFRLTFYHLNPSYHDKGWITVGSGLVFIDQHRIRWI
jgi:hypothetical protein